MMIADVLNARLLANGVIEVHGAAAGDEEDVAHTPIRELPDDVVRKLHEHRTSALCSRTDEKTRSRVAALCMGSPGGNFWSGNFLFGKCITRRRLAGKPGVGAADSFAQWHLDAKVQFFARSRRAGYVAVRRGSSRCGGSDADINFRWQSGGDFARERG